MIYKGHLVVCIFIVPLLFIACEEALPPRDNLTDVFGSSMDVYQEKRGAISRYSLTLTLFVVNKIDETIFDKAQMSGTLEIEWFPPEKWKNAFNTKRTVKLTQRNITLARGYNRTAGTLTINPNDTIVALYEWDFKSDDSTKLFSYFDAKPDYQCFVNYPEYISGQPIGNRLGYRLITTKQKFKISATIKLTPQTSIIHFETLEPDLCFVVPHNGEANPSGQPCLQLHGIDPCKIVGN